LVAEKVSSNILNRDSAAAFIHREDVYWRDNPLAQRASPEDLTKAVKPAFGFWLFLIEAFGPMTKDGMDPDYQAAPNMNAHTPRDVTPYWPELVLSDLS
jgi:hypothetical protein